MIERVVERGGLREKEKQKERESDKKKGRASNPFSPRNSFSHSLTHPIFLYGVDYARKLFCGAIKNDEGMDYITLAIHLLLSSICHKNEQLFFASFLSFVTVSRFFFLLFFLANFLLFFALKNFSGFFELFCCEHKAKFFTFLPPFSFALLHKKK